MSKRRKSRDVVQWATRRRRVLNAWSMFEEDEPDISTERPIAMVCDATGEDYGDVIAFIAEVVEIIVLSLEKTRP